MKRISEIIGEEYQDWKSGNLILIKGGTGSGKTYFVRNILDNYCRGNDKKILYLSNRNSLKEQFKNSLDNQTIIAVMNYQEVEEILLRGKDYHEYDYIICDEAHYFFTDASFNNKTNLVLEKILKDDKIIKLFMTATSRILEYYFQHNDVNINYKYEHETDYSYINLIEAFNTDESVYTIIESIPKDEQIMFFSISAKRAYDVAKKYNGAFICSQYNKDGYYKYVDKDELNNIIINEEFNNHILCCTTALDNGINIKEYSNVKHIIIDIFDRDTFLQVLGRKRIGEGEKINLYFHNYIDKRRISGFKRKIVNSLKLADYLKEYGEEAYVMKNFKNQAYSDTRIIDEIFEEGKIHKVINECMYIKYKADLLFYDAILTSRYITYKSMIALQLGRNAIDILEIEVAKEKANLESYLDSIINKRLYKQEQKELAEIVNIKHDGKLLKSADSINAVFKEKKIQYIIDNNSKNTDWKRRLENGNINHNYGKKYWIINKVID